MKRIIAALSFFTRLPFWRLCDVPADCYKRVVPLWPLAGWLTGGVMAAVFALTVQVLPLPLCVVLALAARTMLTGALHEDGFADFCDGFGGGTTRERVLEIMKDSHIGTYGVLGLIVYYLITYNILTALLPLMSTECSMPIWQAGATLLLVVDSLAKMLSSMIVWWLPYARTAETAKNKLVYQHVSFKEKVTSIITGTLPFVLLCPEPMECNMLIALWAGAIAVCLLLFYMRRRINGYTGDCCGALFVITEAVIYLALLAVVSSS